MDKSDCYQSQGDGTMVILCAIATLCDQIAA